MRQEGFTLFELLFGVTIGGLLLAIGVPSYTTFVQNSRQITSANEMLASFHYARDLAITRNTRVTVCPSDDGTDCDAVDWNNGWIVFIDADADLNVDAGETIERAVPAVEAPSVESSEFGSFLIYRPNGRVMEDTIADNTGALTFCDERGADHARVLIIDVSGRPRVSKEMADGSAPVCP